MSESLRECAEMFGIHAEMFGIHTEMFGIHAEMFGKGRKSSECSEKVRNLCGNVRKAVGKSAETSSEN